MLKQTINYKDFNDQERTEDFYFNINIDELIQLEKSVEGGFVKYLEDIGNATDDRKGLEIMGIFRRIIMLAVGERSDDGRRFSKRDGDVADEFIETNAYQELLFQITTNAQLAAEFVNQLIPQDMIARMQAAIDEELAKQPNPELKEVKNVPLPPAEEEPAWIKENRDPTQEELQSMSQEQLQEAFRRKSQS